MTFMDLLSIILPVTAFIGVLIILSVNVYMNIRRRFSVNVNCWFCNQWCKVPYDLQNSWNCQFCEQYNGFNEDGDYNQPIPAQFDELMNKHIPSAPINNNKLPDSSNGLCNNCNRNQELKIYQLSKFSSIDESKYDEEVERYQKQLDRAYRLCPQCEQTLKKTLHKQKSVVLGLRLSQISKQGLNYLNLNTSHPGISSTAKRNLFLTIIHYTTLVFAIIRLIDVLNTYDFTNQISKKISLPGTIVPYLLLWKDLLILMYNMFSFLIELIRYPVSQFLTVFIGSIQQMFSNVVNIEFIESQMSFLNFDNISRTMILSSVGAFLQFVLLVFNTKVRILESIKCAVWLLLMFVRSEERKINKSESFNILAPELVEITLCLLLITLKSSKNKQKKRIRCTENKIKKKITAAIEEEYFDPEISNNEEILNSTFKSQNSKLNTSDDSNRFISPDRSVSPFNTSASTLKLFNIGSNNKHEHIDTHIFGEKPVFENPLNISYFSSKYRSTKTSDDSLSNDSFNSSPKSHKNNETYLLSDNTDVDGKTELELNKGLSALNLGTQCTKLHYTQVPPAFRVSTPILCTQKPVLSPPRLRNATQSSWVAGGYWKSSNDSFNHSIAFSNLSRSSSQSSGFGSQTSSQQQNFEVFNSLPCSRNNSVCGEYDKYSVFSEPAYQCNSSTFCSQNPPNRFYPAMKPDQQIYICPKTNKPDQQIYIYPKTNDGFHRSNSPPQIQLYDKIWNNSNVTSNPSNILSQTLVTNCPSAFSVLNHTFHQSTPFGKTQSNNLRPLSVSSNHSAFVETHVKGSLLKKWRENNSSVQNC